MRVEFFVVRLVICVLTLCLHQPVSAQNSGQKARAWILGAVEHAQRMRKFKSLNSIAQSTPSFIFKYQFDRNPTGAIATYQPAGRTFTSTNAFFRNLGTNDRTCFTCHQPQEGWSFSAAGAKARFDASSGTDPLFRVFDGATCPSAADATLEDKQKAYKLLTEKGLIRIGLPLPPAADLEFEVKSVDDPYNCTTSPATGLTSPTTGIVSVYRRPLPSANLGFLTSIMWDGREPTLESQATNATLIHAQANAAPNATQLSRIVAFEKGLFNAQIYDNQAHMLNAANATGGPVPLSLQQSKFYIGMNDPDGLDPTGAPFTPEIFSLFKPWEGVLGTDAEALQRQSVARGELVYNSGFCGTCHNTPEIGNRSSEQFQDIGTASGITPPALDITGLPVFTLACKKGPSAGYDFQVTDPGRALITGKCADIGLVKVPGLRGLANRAPYFHNGSAPTLVEVIEFYTRRFGFVLTAQQQQDLVNFLNSL